MHGASSTAREQAQQEAKRFLTALDPNARWFTFQTFDDDEERSERNKPHDPYAHIIQGTLDSIWKRLEDLNDEGAGIFVTINCTDYKGRSTENIKRVRAAFVDLDGTPLDPVLNDLQPYAPHIVVESSPGRYHAYWLLDGLRLEQFKPMQQVLIAHFNSDPKVCDLPRVMRLPGLVHRKGTPFTTTIMRMRNDPPYKADDFLQKLASIVPQPQQQQSQQQQQQSQQTQQEAFDAYLAAPGAKKLNIAALHNLAAWVPEIFPGVIEKGDEYRITSKRLNRNLQEDLVLSPRGIMDFGLRDMGDKDEGRRSAIDIVKIYGKKPFKEACDWLCDQLKLPKLFNQALHA